MRLIFVLLSALLLAAAAMGDEIMVAMRDGVKLHTNVVLPWTTGKLPAVYGE
jgi:predicted acyl esterase